MDLDIHNYKKRLESTIRRIDENNHISKLNKKTIHRFKDYCLCNNISYGKIDAYLCHLKNFALMMNKPFEKAKKEDIMKIMARLKEMDNYTEQSKVSFRIMVRKLYKMIRGVEGKGEYPPEVSWISTGLGKNYKKLPEELLNDEEIKLIIQNCDNVRDKAFISVLAESGCRISEIGTMQLKHISFEEYGARLIVTGKTGARRILVIFSSPYLQQWINNHPTNTNTESYLWIKSDGKPLSYARLAAILKHSAKKAGIKKRVYCHLLRHSRATKLAKVMSGSTMNAYLGWAQGSKMSGVYIHMSGKDADDVILKANGIEIKENNSKPVMQPSKCSRCNTINEATNKFCKICGLPLNKEEAEKIIQRDLNLSEADNFMNKLFQDQEYQEFVKKKMKELQMA